MSTSSPPKKTPKCIPKVHRQYVFARAIKAANQLIDRGANGGLAGSDMLVLQETTHKITIVGINNHELPGLPVVTGAVVLQMSQGPVVVMFMNMHTLERGAQFMPPVNSNGFIPKWMCFPRLLVVHNTLSILEGYTIPISIDSGLVYIHPVHIPSDHDLQTFLHLFFTSPPQWDPTVLNHGIILCDSMMTSS